MLTFFLYPIHCLSLSLGIVLIFLSSIVFLPMCTGGEVQASKEPDPLSPNNSETNSQDLLAIETNPEALDSINSNDDFLISLVDALWEIGVAKGPGSFENGFFSKTIEDLIAIAILQDTSDPTPATATVSVNDPLEITVLPETSNPVNFEVDAESLLEFTLNLFLQILT